MPRSDISFADNLTFIFKMALRCLCFAIGGAFGMALCGGAHGLWTGAFASTSWSQLWPSQDGAMIGWYIATYVGAITGAASFFIAALLSYSVRSPGAIFLTSLKNAIKWSSLGVLVCGIAGGVNFYAFGTLVLHRYDMSRFGWGFICGVVTGCTLGTFYGAIKGALLEVQRQRAEPYA
jgi:hypothetical protein